MEREKINDETEMKKSKISREDVEDELEYSYDHVSLQCEENFDENQSKDTENRPKRRYRRKGEGEEGEIEGSPVDWSRSRSRSYRYCSLYKMKDLNIRKTIEICGVFGFSSRVPQKYGMNNWKINILFQFKVRLGNIFINVG